MTLRSDFSSAHTTALINARDAGIALITTNLASIASQMNVFALQGKASFTISLQVTYQPDDIRAVALLKSAYESGVLSKLFAEDMFENEITLTWDTSDATDLYLDIAFAF